MPDKLVIRADASARMGIGHVMRCLALAQGWLCAGGQAVFAQADSTPALEQRLRREGMEVMPLNAVPGSESDARQTTELARANGASWIMADGYGFGADWQKQVKEAGCRLLLCDDYGHAEHYYADLVLNQNLHAKADLYSQREPYTRLLLGIRYVQLRREFLEWRGWKREIPAIAHKVLVTLGGSDPDNVTGKVVDALRNLDIQARIVVGGLNPHFDSLTSIVLPPSTILRDVTNMPELMAWADVAVAASGSTAWELPFMGLPSVLIVLAANQTAIAAALNQGGIVVNLGKSQDLTSGAIAASLRTLCSDIDCRHQMSRLGRELLDGVGAAKVVTRMKAEELGLRRALAQDCRLIWDWANDPELRAASFSTEHIPWENHVHWYTAKLADPNCFLFIGVDGTATPIGLIRFEQNGREGLVSVAVSPSARGRGYGSALIIRGVEQFFIESKAEIINAYIKPDNPRSLRSFEKAGFKLKGMAEVRGSQAQHHVLCRDDI